jgi:hypothetical protein
MGNPLVLALAVLVFAEIFPVTSDADETMAANNILYGAVNVKTEDSIIKQPYHYTSMAGERTITALPDGFPLTCTTCDPGSPTEYCDYDAGVCFKLTNLDISLFSTNGSLLYGSPYALDNQCTPRYLQKLNGRKYAIVCKESSYQLFQLAEDGSPVLHRIGYGLDGATGGILVQSVGSLPELYHVELMAGYIFTYEVDRSKEGHMEPICAQDLLLHTTFSSRGLFFLSCSSVSGSRRFFLYSVETHNFQELELCANPLPSLPGPTGDDTFAVACGNSLTVYSASNVTNSWSASFEGSIVTSKYLDHTTVLVDTGNKHHIVNVETSMYSGASDGIVTVNDTATCSLVQKLITPDVYATACRRGALYEVRLVNKTSGQSLAPIENLTMEPQDIYFEAQEPPPTSPDTPADTPENTGTPPAGTNDIPPPSDQPIAPTAAAGSTSAAPEIPSNPQSPTSAGNVSPKPTLDSTHATIVIAVATVVFVAVTLLVLLFVYMRMSKKKKRKFCMGCKKQKLSHVLQEEGDGDNGCSQTYVSGINNPTTSLTTSVSSGHNSSNSSITYTTAVIETGSL